MLTYVLALVYCHVHIIIKDMEYERYDIFYLSFVFVITSDGYHNSVNG